MPWLSLIPAFAIVTALVILSVGLRRVEHEVVALRASLRRTQATAVAADEFGRSAERVADRADQLRHSAPQRVGISARGWSRPRSIGR